AARPAGCAARPLSRDRGAPATANLCGTAVSTAAPQPGRPCRTRPRATEGCSVPTGRVKWFNPEKGFGFLSREDGPDVFMHKDALPAGTTELKPGQRVEFGIVAGRRGDQALQVRVLDPLPSVAATVAAASRKKPDELVPIIEDLIKLLDDTSNSLRRGRYPDRAVSRKV